MKRLETRLRRVEKAIEQPDNELAELFAQVNRRMLEHYGPLPNKEKQSDAPEPEMSANELV